jgi:hypothetical protein
MMLDAAPGGIREAIDQDSQNEYGPESRCKRQT